MKPDMVRYQLASLVLETLLYKSSSLLCPLPPKMGVDTRTSIKMGYLVGDSAKICAERVTFKVLMSGSRSGVLRFGTILTI